MAACFLELGDLGAESALLLSKRRRQLLLGLGASRLEVVELGVESVDVAEGLLSQVFDLRVHRLERLFRLLVQSGLASLLQLAGGRLA